MQTVPGYGITATYDGHTLTVTPKNMAFNQALRGAELVEQRLTTGEKHDGAPLVIPREAIASVDWKPAKRLTNGNLTVHTSEGRKYQLHFLRKHQDGMTDLARQLGAQV